MWIQAWPEMSVYHRWQQWKEHVLLRPVPHTLVSWRFLLPGQSRAVKLHRKVFLGAWPRRPRWQWALITLYSGVTWLLFFSWQQIYFCMKDRSRQLCTEFGVSPRKQLFDVLCLAFLHGIPAEDYYEYGLFRRARKQWFEYIYPHELPHWHQVLSAGASRETLHLIADKKNFGEQMAAQGLASVETCAFLASGMPVTKSDIFSGHSFFFKPNTGSQGDGCFALSMDGKTGQYRLCGDEIFEGEDDILAEINRRVQQQDYLVQPLLQNHQLIADLCGAQLAPLRLVTGMLASKPVALFASLGIPCSDELNTYWWLDIDVASGEFFDRGDVKPDEFHRIMQRMGKTTIPFWSEVVDICLKAHLVCPDLPGIGWDVAITSSGVKLLEGNFNWGVDVHQLFNGPALDTVLVDIYQ